MTNTTRLIAEAFPDSTIVSVEHHGPRDGGLSHAQKGNHMTTPQQPIQDQTDEPDAWDVEEGTAYPELPANPHNHVYTWSPKLADGSMLVIRSNTAAGLVTAAEAVAGVAGQLTQLWGQASGRPAPAAPQYLQATQRPNVPYQGQPAWQQDGAPQQNGGYQQKPQPQGPAAPQGWFKLTGNCGQGGVLLKQHAQSIGLPKGNPSQGGKFNFWSNPGKGWYCAPEATQALAQFQPVPV